MRAYTKNRRGVAAVIAMLYLVLFSSLAVGFAAATDTAVQVARNDNLAHRAMLAAESGLDFVSAYLRSTSIPHTTKPENLLDEVYSDLSDMMDGTPNIGGGDIVVVDDVIHIPAPGSFIELPREGGRFQATIQQVGHQLRVRVAGVYETAVVSARGIQMDFAIAENASPIFNFGVASKGTISTGGASRIRGATDPKKGSVLSTSPELVPVSIGGKEVSGDISISNPDGRVSFGGGASIGGTTSTSEIVEEHIHVGIDPPEFPVIDTDPFLPFITNPLTGQKRYYGGSGTVENMVIRANTNPTFSGGTLAGVVYIETPNKITFRGNTTIKGLLVVQNNPTGNVSTNVLDFAGNTSAVPVNLLQRTDVPSLDAERYDALKKMTGSFILAPNFHTSFTGSFGTISGSIISGKVSMAGNAGGTIMGSVINMTTAPMAINGSSEIIIASSGTSDFPAGVYFSDHYVPLADTYEEFKPRLARRPTLAGADDENIGDLDDLFRDLPAFAVDDLAGHFEGTPYPDGTHAVPEPGIALGLVSLALVLTRRPARR